MHLKESKVANRYAEFLGDPKKLDLGIERLELNGRLALVALFVLVAIRMIPIFSSPSYYWEPLDEVHIFDVFGAAAWLMVWTSIRRSLLAMRLMKAMCERRTQKTAAGSDPTAGEVE